MNLLQKIGGEFDPRKDRTQYGSFPDLCDVKFPKRSGLFFLNALKSATRGMIAGGILGYGLRKTGIQDINASDIAYNLAMLDLAQYFIRTEVNPKIREMVAFSRTLYHYFRSRHIN